MDESFFNNAYQKAIFWARALLNTDDGHVLILDTETTGLDETAEVVQIALIDLKGNEVFNRLVKPVNPIPAEATAIHGITNEMVANAQTFAELYEDFCQAIYGKTIVIYNAAYDQRVLRQTINWHATIPASLPWQKVECAMLRYAEFVGEWDNRRGSFRWQRLPAGDHSAVGDCQATLSLIRRMAETPLLPAIVREEWK